jgi:hypothetical protein
MSTTAPPVLRATIKITGKIQLVGVRKMSSSPIASMITSGANPMIQY